MFAISMEAAPAATRPPRLFGTPRAREFRAALKAKNRFRQPKTRNDAVFLGRIRPNNQRLDVSANKCARWAAVATTPGPRTGSRAAKQAAHPYSHRAETALDAVEQSCGDTSSSSP